VHHRVVARWYHRLQLAADRFLDVERVHTNRERRVYSTRMVWLLRLPLLRQSGAERTGTLSRVQLPKRLPCGADLIAKLLRPGTF
jgi:hypothetical protein